ncbi:MAG: hypothetical protein WCI05_06175, partial [Myxococcales bacterium]
GRGSSGSDLRFSRWVWFSLSSGKFYTACMVKILGNDPAKTLDFVTTVTFTEDATGKIVSLTLQPLSSKTPLLPVGTTFGVANVPVSNGAFSATFVPNNANNTGIMIPSDANGVTGRGFDVLGANMAGYISSEDRFCGALMGLISTIQVQLEPNSAPCIFTRMRDDTTVVKPSIADDYHCP